MGKYTEGGGRATDCQDNVTIKNGTWGRYSRRVSSRESTIKKYDCGHYAQVDPKRLGQETNGGCDIHKIVQLLKSNQMSTYKAQEIDSLAIRVLLRYRKDLIWKMDYCIGRQT